MWRSRSRTSPRDGVFENISFELRKGEILGMAGLVGAGRTDVARAIFGVEPPTSGTIQVEGKEVAITLAAAGHRPGAGATCPRTASCTA